MSIEGVGKTKTPRPSQNATPSTSAYVSILTVSTSNPLRNERPADRRNHLVRDPALEGLGLGLAGAEDERVEAGFVDNYHFLFAARGAN